MNPLKKKSKFTWFDLVKAFWFIAGEKRKIFFALAFILFVAQFYWIIPPFVLGKIVDFLTNYQKGSDFSQLYIYIFTWGLLHIVVSFVRLEVKKKMGNIRTDMVYNTRVKGFEKLTALSLKSSKETAGSKAQKIQNGTEAIHPISKMIYNDIFIAITSVIGIVFVFITMKPIYIIYLLGYQLLFILIIKYFYNKIQKLNYNLNRSLENAAGSYVEGLNNVMTLKALGAESSFKTRVEGTEETRRQFEYQIRNTSNNQWKIFQILNALYIIIFLVVITKDVLAGVISVGSIVIFYGYTDRLIMNSVHVMDLYEELIQSKTRIGRMMSVFWKKDLSQSSPERIKKFPQKWSSFKIRRGYFSYVKRDKLKKELTSNLKNINLTIKKNQKIGVVGKTGSGKSTLAKLLIGLYSLDKGQYLIGKTNFYQINKDEVHKNMAIVLQDSEMFNLPLKENITLMKKVEPAFLKKAIQIAQLEEVINKLPQGLNTLIGEKGYRLSGGERQRVGIARALCRQTDIIIFDEATSSLDSKTESLIYDALEENFKEKTLLFVAHRISTLANIDLIYVFQEGEIIEKGKYNELLNNPNSYFSRLYHKRK